MTSQDATQITYANAYSTVLSTGVIANSNPAYGWMRVGQAAIARTTLALRRSVAAYQDAKARRASAHSAARLMRKAMALQATHPGFANELMAIASRSDHHEQA